MVPVPPRDLIEPCSFCGGHGRVQRLNPEFVRWVRRSHGLSVDKAAQLVGLSGQYWSQVERGVRRMLEA